MVVRKGCYKLFERWGIDAHQSQTPIAIFDAIAAVMTPFLRTLLKVGMTVYLVLLGPILEEWIFRNKFWVEGTRQEYFATKLFRLVANAVVFGLLHISPSQGWMNLPIFLIVTLSGLVLASLREYTGSSRAPTIAHILHNSTMMLRHHLGTI